MVMRGMQARRFADGAGDIFDATAVHALEVVVVVECVLHLVEGACGIGKAHASDDAGSGEIVQDAMDGGQCDTAEIITQVRMHRLSRCVRASTQNVEHCDALNRDAQPGGTQSRRCGECRGRGGHDSSVAFS